MRKFSFIVLAIFLCNVSPLRAGQLADLNSDVKTATVNALLDLIPPQGAKKDETKWLYTIDDVNSVTLSLALLGEEKKAEIISRQKFVSPWMGRIPHAIKYLPLIREINQGKYTRAEKQIPQIGNHATRLDTYIFLAQVQKEHGKLDAALRNVRHAEELILGLTRESERTKARFVVARAYLRMDRKETAQKVLSDVTIAAQTDFRTRDTLFDLQVESGDIDDAKSTFHTLQQMLIPWPKDYVPNAKDGNENTDKARQYRSAENERSQLSHSLLQAGWIDEWKVFYNKELKQYYKKESIPAYLLKSLAEAGEIDLVLDLTHKYLPLDERIYNLSTLSLVLAQKHNDYANTLLNQATLLLEKHWDELPRDTKQLGSSRKFLAGVLISASYNALGNPKKAQKWMQKSFNDVPEKKKGIWEMLSVMYRTSYISETGQDKTLSDQQLERFNNALQKYIHLLSPTTNSMSNFSTENLWTIRWLINQQIKAGKKTQAKANLAYLDTAARQRLQDKNDKGRYSNAITVANTWKRLGAEMQCHSLLQATMQSFVPSKRHPSKVSLIQQIISNGLFKEGLNLLQKIPPKERKDNNGIFSSLGYEFAKGGTNHFPAKVLQDMTPHERILFLKQFVTTLVGETYSRNFNRKYGYDMYMDNSVMWLNFGW